MGANAEPSSYAIAGISARRRFAPCPPERNAMPKPSPANDGTTATQGGLFPADSRGAPFPPSSRRQVLAAGALLALAAAAAYQNSFSGPFVYDDGPAIVENTTLRAFGTALFPPAGTTTSGRPLVNLAFALDYAIGGHRVGVYHAFNFLIHLCAGLTLFGLVRRTLLLPLLRPRYGALALPLGCVVGVLWTVHPLQTESVTYVVQRAESLMGLFYFLTFYGFVRASESAPSTRWMAASGVACLAGMACKEVMVSAPVMVFLYDRTFVSGSFRAAWKSRRSYYVALAGTWLLLAFLVVSTGGNRGGTVGFGVGVPWWAYWATQFRAVTHYLALGFWPYPLIFEYGTFWESSAVAVAPHAIGVLALAGATLAALWRRPALGFLGAWFFALLAPTSLMPGTTQMIVEHRTYLALAAVVVGAALAAEAWLRSWAIGVLGAAALPLVWLTGLRNADYQSELSLWSETVAKRPGGALAQCNLAIALAQQQRLPEALAHYETSLALAPDVPNTCYNYGLALARVGHTPEAIAQYETALRAKPDFAAAHVNRANLLLQAGRTAEALASYEQAVRYAPNDAEIHGSLANALFQGGRVPEALQHYERGLTLVPEDADLHYNFAGSLLQLGRTKEAIDHYRRSIGKRPNDADAHYNLGVALAAAGRREESAAEWRQTLRLRPDYAAARESLDRGQAASLGNDVR